MVWGKISCYFGEVELSSFGGGDKGLFNV